MTVPTSNHRYSLRQHAEGSWSVIDTDIDFPVVVRERLLVCLDEGDAVDAANLLNMIEGMRSPVVARASTTSPNVNPLLLPVR